MSVRFRKIVRRILVAAGVLVGLVVLIVVGAVVTSWYLSFEGFAYDWDPLVENTSGRAGNHYESDRRHRGVAVKGLGAPDFDQAVRDNVEWVALTPFGWQRGLDAPDVFSSDQVESWAPTDVQIRRAVEAAHNTGLRVMLKPHLWLTESRGWRADIAMTNDADWAGWFEAYGAFILHHARAADSLGVEMLCIGTELAGTVARETEWRTLIAAVREVYKGQLIYAANWDGEFEDVAFWDALDAIGVQAYFPLTEERVPSVTELTHAWAPHAEQIARVATRFDRPVIFTEIGYRSVVSSAARPWEWGMFFFFERVSRETQVNCYEAMFETFWDEPWFGGLYVWTWYPYAEPNSGYLGRGFTPMGKPAENVMARWFGKGLEVGVDSLDGLLAQRE